MKSDCIDHGQPGNRDGYGSKWHQGKVEKLHRLAFCKANNIGIEEISGRIVRHKCDNARCINPRHLLLGSQAENMTDMASRCRTKHRKLSDEAVAEIRAICRPNANGSNRVNPVSYAQLARRFGVDSGAVRKAHLRISFKHLP